MKNSSSGIHIAMDIGRNILTWKRGMDFLIDVKM